MTSDPGLEQLTELYRSAGDDEFALFLGSGVNGGSWAKTHPACASWKRLLEVVAERHGREHELAAAQEACGNDWIGIASRCLHGLDRATVAETIDAVFYDGVFRDPTTRARQPTKHRVLAWKVLRGMNSLSAAVCFTAAIHDPNKRRSMRRNPKVDRVLTTNYDFFFGAAWPRYTSMKRSWKPVTWKSEREPAETAGRIIYLHGYLPYSGTGEKDVVLTRDEYAEAYAREGEGRTGRARRELTEAVSTRHLIFLGFSFSDPNLADVLASAGGLRRHFALLHERDVGAIEATREIGVTPVPIGSWGEVPGTLRTVYGAGLNAEELERTGMRRDTYWAKLEGGVKPRQA